MRQVHVAGEKVFVDYAGMRPTVVNATTGEVIAVELFVAVLGASNYTFAEATRTQQSADWILSHSHAVEYFGGIPPCACRTNCARASRSRAATNLACSGRNPDWAEHYHTVVIPARPAKPRDKAYVSYCTSSRLRNGESWLLGPSASLAF